MIIWKILKFFFKAALTIALIFVVFMCITLGLVHQCTSNHVYDSDPEPVGNIDGSMDWRYRHNSYECKGVIIQCPVCGKYFPKENTNFCSKECENIYWSRKKTNQRIEDKRDLEYHRRYGY